MNPAATEQPPLSAAETVQLGAARLRELPDAPGYTKMLATMLDYLADHSEAPDAVLAARLRAFALEAARAVLQEDPGTEPAAEPTTPGAVPEPAEEHWYGSSWWWDNPQVCLRVAVPVLAEMVGAGIVGADAGDADDLYWRGYSNQAHWDVRGAGFLVDVKRAWTEDADTVGFAGPQKPDDNDLYLYDQDKVHDILIVHLLDQDVSTTHGYEPDGTAFLTMRGTPRAAYRIPVPEFNEMVATGVIHRHSKLRFTVATRDLENHQVRGPWTATANPSPPMAAQEDTEKRPEPAQGEQTT